MSTPTKKLAGLKSGTERKEKKTVSGKKKKSKVVKMSVDLRSGVKSVASLCLRSELKSEGKVKDPSLPAVLGSGGSTLVLTLTEEATMLRNTMRSMLGTKVYTFDLSTILSVSTSGAGILNSISNNFTLAANTDLISLAGVFQECFVVSQRCHWMPVSRYQYPLTGVTATSVANLPIGVASLQHAALAYTTISQSSENYAFALHSTGDPFVYTWHNSENPNSGVAVDAGSGSTVPCQGWSNSSLMSNYTGFVQFISGTAPPALPFSQQVAQLHVKWHCLFRCRE